MFSQLSQQIRHQLPLVILTALITLGFLLEKTYLYEWNWINRAENLLYDLRIVATMPNEIDERIVIVDIDEKSLREIGRWPWSRNNIAKLVEELFNYYEITILGFDIVFAEPDNSSGLNVLKALGKSWLSDNNDYKQVVDTLETELDYDQLLANAINDNQVVMGYYFKYGRTRDDSTNNGLLPPASFTSADFKNKSVLARDARGYGGNIEKLLDAALDAGHFSPWLDDDGVVRRVPMLYQFGENYYEALSLVIVKHLLEIERTIPVFEQSAGGEYPGLETLSLEYLDIPVDIHTQALVPYRGVQGSFPYISATDVIHGRVNKDILKDAIVLVGTTAPGLFDLRTTPVQKQFPGVEVHANLISGILDEKIKLSPAYLEGAEFIQLILIGIFMTLLLPRLNPILATVTSSLIMITIIGINLLLWHSVNLVMPLASSLILIAIIFVANMSYGFFVERRGKQQLAAIFGTYIPPELIDEMNVNPDSYTLEPENRDMTVLFSDVRGFTTISEGLSPTELSELINAYLTEMTKIIHEKRGTIDKYIGDAVMAFWGAPLDNAEHAKCAVETAMAMLERLNAIRSDFVERGWPDLHIGVGINSGNMSVGNMGSEFRMSYTVMGDAVNLGSRLEGLTKNYGVEVIVSEGTVNAVPEYIYRELDYVRVKGKEKPIAIFEPVALKTEISKQELDEVQVMSEALKAYRQQQWLQAEQTFKRLQTEYSNKKLYAIYLDRISTFIQETPGSGWDGVYTHTSK
ncbi:MAG: adenylate/guanylate cyclase domain-containing protein [Pseudomonadota bacterium]